MMLGGAGHMGMQIDEQQIKSIILNQFSSAMERHIKPMLEEQLKDLIDRT